MNYLARHLQVFLATLGSLIRSPISSLNIISIIAVTLLLPALFYILIMSIYQISDHWQGRPQITVFLQEDISEQEATLIYDEIKLYPTVALAEYISPSQALSEFKMLSGLDKEIDFIGTNPLPSSIVLMPISGHTSTAKLEKLQTQLSKIDGIEQIRLDLDWVKKFNAIIYFIGQIAQVFSALLLIALLFIIGNTIKLVILNRRDEIEITKLVGGTNIFIRRPFVYYGMLVGAFGAVLAIIAIYVIQQLLGNAIADISGVFQTTIKLYQPSIQEFSYFLLIGASVGWLAARISVARHLHQIQPR